MYLHVLDCGKRRTKPKRKLIQRLKSFVFIKVWLEGEFIIVGDGKKSHEIFFLFHNITTLVHCCKYY